MNINLLRSVAIITACSVIFSCGALRTFHEYARAGDTIAVPVGMKPDFKRTDINVTITPSVGAPIVLTGTDPAVRALINFYPDPVSNMVISKEIGTDLSPFAQTYSDSITFDAGEDRDHYQTTVFLDLPTSLPTGLTQIDVTNSVSGATHSATLDVISGTGSPNTFDSDFNGQLLLNENMLNSMSRAPHTTITLSSATIPSAIEINLTHDPDETAGGTGKAFAVNPLGYRKNLIWHDDGINMKVIMTETNNGVIDHINDYKFYVAGTVTGLVLQSVAGYDANGDAIAGVTATLTPF